jgi:hypothetical protein
MYNYNMECRRPATSVTAPRSKEYRCVFPKCAEFVDLKGDEAKHFRLVGPLAALEQLLYL